VVGYTRRPMPDDRPRGRPPFTPQRPRPAGAPPFAPRGPGGPPYASRPGGPPFAPRPGGTPFTPRPGGAPPPPPRPVTEPLHTVRLRDGEREVEVSGSAGFVRQLLDDLPALLGRLRAEPAPSRPASISMPPPPTLPTVAASPAPPEAVEEPVEVQTPEPATNGHGPMDALTRQVLAVMRRTGRPISIAEIRERLSDPVSGQQVRRVLERASERVVNTGGRPAEYRLR
jgi:hypothetical protein